MEDEHLQQCKAEAERLLQEGAAFVREGRLRKALPCFERACEVDPGNVEAWASRGAALARLNRSWEGMQCMDEAVRLAPDDAEAWFVRGSLHAGMERFDRALRDICRSLELRPGVPRVLDYARRVMKVMGPLALQEFLQGQSEETREELLRLAPSAPSLERPPAVSEAALSPLGAWIVEVVDDEGGVHAELGGGRTLGRHSEEAVRRRWLERLRREGREVAPDGRIEGRYELRLRFEAR